MFEDCIYDLIFEHSLFDREKCNQKRNMFNYYSTIDSIAGEYSKALCESNAKGCAYTPNCQ